MYPIDLAGKNGVVLGVANDRSIAWAVARLLGEAGARLAFTYQNDRLKGRVTSLAESLPGAVTAPCDATDDGQIADLFDYLKGEFGSLSFLVHSIAFANREDLTGNFSETGREGFRLALEVSAYSLIPLVRHAAPLMADGGSVVTMTFQASQRVYPGYNVMGTAKAALEHEVRQLAAEFGERGIRFERHIGGPGRNAGREGHQRFHRYAAHPCREGGNEAQHHRGGSGEVGPVPVQRPIQRDYRLGDSGGRRLPHHGGVRGAVGYSHRQDY